MMIFFSWESHSMLIVDYFAIAMPIHNHNMKVQTLFRQSKVFHFLGFGVNSELIQLKKEKWQKNSIKAFLTW